MILIPTCRHRHHGSRKFLVGIKINTLTPWEMQIMWWSLTYDIKNSAGEVLPTNYFPLSFKKRISAEVGEKLGGKLFLKLLFFIFYFLFFISPPIFPHSFAVLLFFLVWGRKFYTVFFLFFKIYIEHLFLEILPCRLSKGFLEFLWS